MKDKTHHLKHLQRKVVQSARKEELQEKEKEKEIIEVTPEEQKIVSEEAIEDEPMRSPDRRATRLPSKSGGIH